MTKNSEYGTNTGFICFYDINVAERQTQDTTMSKERLKRAYSYCAPCERGDAIRQAGANKETSWFHMLYKKR